MTPPFSFCNFPRHNCHIFCGIKAMRIAFFYVNGLVHGEFVPHGQTADQRFYIEVASASTGKKCSEKWRTMTMHLRTLRCQPGSFWPRTTWLLQHTRQISSPATFCCSRIQNFGSPLIYFEVQLNKFILWFTLSLLPRYLCSIIGPVFFATLYVCCTSLLY